MFGSFLKNNSFTKVTTSTVTAMLPGVETLMKKPLFYAN